MLEEVPEEAAPFRIRRATAADAGALADFAARTFRHTYGPAGDPATGGGSRAEDVETYVAAHFSPAHQRTELGDAGLVTFLAEGDDGLAGYAQLALPGARAADAELARLYVDPARQGRGVASGLLDAVVEAAQGAGGERVRLFVYQRNVRAVAFYRRRGFVVAEVTQFRMGSDVQDDWMMVLPLAPLS